MELNEKDACIYCGTPLSKWENIRSYCWDCQELTAYEPIHEHEKES